MCTKYEYKFVTRQEFVAECQVAAYAYADALRTLKLEK